MTSPPSHPSAESAAAAAAAATRVGGGAIVLRTLALVLVVTVIAWPTFGVRPSGDDFGMPLMTSIHAAREGVVRTLFVPNQPMRYRPLESVAMYAAQSLPIGDVLVRVRLLHLASFGAYLVAVLLFGRAVGLTRVSLSIAAAVAALHPVQIACYGGMDNFSVHALFAIVFAGMAWLVSHSRASLPAVAAVGFATTIASSCFKEYGFGTALFAPLVVWITRPGPRPARARAAAGAFVGACAAVLTHQALKRLLLPEGMASDTPTPLRMAGLVPANLALYLGGTSFFGSTLDVATRPTIPRLAWMAVLIGLAAVLLGWGLALAWRSSHAGGIAGRGDGGLGGRRRIVLLLACVVPTMMPNVLVTRISEVYLPGVVAIFSLLCGVAAEGFAGIGRVDRSRRRWVVPAACVALLLASAIVATRGKAIGLRRSGEQADEMLRALRAALPPDLTAGEVALLFPPGEGRVYSVYRMHAQTAIDQPRADWWRDPTSRLTLTTYVGTDVELAAVDLHRFAAAVRWDASARRFVPHAIDGTGAAP